MCFLIFHNPENNFKLLKLDHQCRSHGQKLISIRFDSNSCASACKEEYGCKYFITTASGNCYWEKAVDGSCPEGWIYVVGSNFYETAGNYFLLGSVLSLINFELLSLTMVKK